MGAFLRPKLLSGAKGNWGQYKNPNVDKMLEEHVRTMDLAKRHEIMKEVLKTVYESAELTSAYAITQAVGTHKKVEGIRTHWRYNVAGEVWLKA
jgi:peptide/nickel transport system substrate-binding protein